MTRASVAQVSFTQGELSPNLDGRFDIPQYYAGASLMLNFKPRTEGPATFREGFEFIWPTREANNPAILIPFQFNDEQAYIIEATATAMRFFTTAGILTEAADTITGITQANPGVVTTSAAHGYSNGDYVIIEDVEGMTEVNGQEFQVANVTATTYELSGIDTTSYTAYSAAGSSYKIVQVTTPYTASQLEELQYAQNADTMYIAHREHNPKKLTRTSATSFSIADHSPTALTLTADNRPGAVTFYEQRLIYGGSNNDPQKLWFSKAGDIDDFTTGTADGDGLTFTIASREVNVIVYLVGMQTQLVVGTYGDSFIAQGPNNEAITPTNISVRPSDGIGAERQPPILLNNQVIFTQRGQRILRAYSYNLEADGFRSDDLNVLSSEITLGNIKQLAFQRGRPEIIYCAKNDGEMIPVSYNSGQGVLGWHRYRTRNGDEITSVATLPRSGQFDQVWIVTKREINGATKYYVEAQSDPVDFDRLFDFYTDTSTRLSDAATYRNKVLEQQKLYKYLDSSITYDGSSIGTAASATMTPGATTGSGVTFTASASVFAATDVGREIWKKSVTGAETGRAIITSYSSATSVDCTIIQDFDSTDAIAAGNWYLTTDTVGALYHLNGETVQVVADGAIHPDKTVTSNSITLDYQASVVHIGFKYRGIIVGMNLEVGGIAGPSQGKFKSIYGASIQFLNTLGAQFGTTLYNLKRIAFRSTGDVMDAPPQVFCGTKNIFFDGQTTNEKRIVIVQDLPLPCTVTQVVPSTRTNNS